MQLLDETNTESYLRETNRVGAFEPITVRELPGGVSNVVLYVSRPEVLGGDFVLKQARRKLRVQQPWYCSVERIWREVETLRVCQAVLSGEPAGLATGVHSGVSSFVATTPRVLWEDRENHAFAMSAAPPHRVWKYDLLADAADERIALACGKLLGRLHAGTWRNADVATRLADKTFFNDLRIDPYYRRIAEVHPQIRSDIERLIESARETSLSLVHGDFSPKNLLVYEDGIMLVDCEVGHFGDPAFDVGFLLTHLSLKAILQAPEHEPFLSLARVFWNVYDEILAQKVTKSDRADLSKRAMANLAGCVLARVDGKSPVEYINDLRQKEAARRFSYSLFQEPRAAWEEAETLLREICESLPHAKFWQDTRS